MGLLKTLFVYFVITTTVAASAGMKPKEQDTASEEEAAYCESELSEMPIRVAPAVSLKGLAEEDIIALPKKDREAIEEMLEAGAFDKWNKLPPGEPLKISKDTTFIRTDNGITGTFQFILNDQRFVVAQMTGGPYRSTHAIYPNMRTKQKSALSRALKVAVLKVKRTWPSKDVLKKWGKRVAIASVVTTMVAGATVAYVKEEAAKTQQRQLENKHYQEQEQARLEKEKADKRVEGVMALASARGGNRGAAIAKNFLQSHLHELDFDHVMRLVYSANGIQISGFNGWSKEEGGFRKLEDGTKEFPPKENEYIGDEMLRLYYDSHSNTLTGQQIAEMAKESHSPKQKDFFFNEAVKKF